MGLVRRPRRGRLDPHRRRALGAPAVGPDGRADRGRHQPVRAVLAFIQFPGSGLGFAMGLMPLVILWYLSSAEVKEAFGVADIP